MNVRSAIDASKLPSGAIGSRAPLWWGMVSMMAIEGMVFALGIASYFFFRMRYVEWPPPDAGNPSLTIPTINLALMLVSVLPVAWVDKKAQSESANEALVLLLISAAFMITSVVLRYYEFWSLNTLWHESSYGSIVWGLLGTHAIHIFASTSETLVLAFYIVRRPLDEKHRLDINTNSLYWFFVVGTWIPLYCVLYIAPRLL